MSKPIIVDVYGEPAGIVRQEGNVSRFNAIARPFFELDDTPINTPDHARLAAADPQRETGRAASRPWRGP
jgi:hypothetical protein